MRKKMHTNNSARYHLRSAVNGRAGEIRTHDPLHPMQVRYQTALRPGPGTDSKSLALK